MQRLRVSELRGMVPRNPLVKSGSFAENAVDVLPAEGKIVVCPSVLTTPITSVIEDFSALEVLDVKRVNTGLPEGTYVLVKYNYESTTNQYGLYRIDDAGVAEKVTASIGTAPKKMEVGPAGIFFDNEYYVSRIGSAWQSFDLKATYIKLAFGGFSGLSLSGANGKYFEGGKKYTYHFTPVLPGFVELPPQLTFSFTADGDVRFGTISARLAYTDGSAAVNASLVDRVRVYRSESFGELGTEPYLIYDASAVDFNAKIAAASADMPTDTYAGLPGQIVTEIQKIIDILNAAKAIELVEDESAAWDYIRVSGLAYMDMVVSGELTPSPGNELAQVSSNVFANGYKWRRFASTPFYAIELPGATSWIGSLETEFNITSAIAELQAWKAEVLGASSYPPSPIGTGVPGWVDPAAVPQATWDETAGYAFGTDPFLDVEVSTQIGGFTYAITKPDNTQFKGSYLVRSLPFRPYMFNWSNDILQVPFVPHTMVGYRERVWGFAENQVFRMDARSMFVEEHYSGVGASPGAVYADENFLVVANKEALFFFQDGGFEVVSPSDFGVHVGTPTGIVYYAPYKGFVVVGTTDAVAFYRDWGMTKLTAYPKTRCFPTQHIGSSAFAHATVQGGIHRIALSRPFKGPVVTTNATWKSGWVSLDPASDCRLRDVQLHHKSWAGSVAVTSYPAGTTATATGASVSLLRGSVGAKSTHVQVQITPTAPTAEAYGFDVIYRSIKQGKR